MSKNKILIADDAELNREMLTLILGDRYDYVYAENGLQAVEILGRDTGVDIVLLDINMPEMDGFEVLRIMNEQQWIKDIPVIIISAEDTVDFITKGYDLGVCDYINRPFHSVVVQRRVENTLILYSNQKKLVQLVEKQVYDREKINNSMINIFSNIIETRNHESGRHTLNVQIITNLLLNELTSRTDRYRLTKQDIYLISSLSALHDIGKIRVPEDVLNKPGKLTEEEWALMKAHTTDGDEILSDSNLDQDSVFIRTARSICRWHHEKYDGHGYPDGLVGDDIPIAAQVVSMADVYDALTSERCYKSAYSHEKAMEMILAGECGAFNPLLLECIKAVAPDLKNIIHEGAYYDFRSDVMGVANEILSGSDLPEEAFLRRVVENERRKKDFFMDIGSDIRFEYDRLSGKTVFTNLGSGSDDKRKVFFTSRDSEDNILPGEYWDRFREKLLLTRESNAVVTMDVRLIIDGVSRPYRGEMLAVWSGDENEYAGVVGSFTPIEE